MSKHNNIHNYVIFRVLVSLIAYIIAMVVTNHIRFNR